MKPARILVIDDDDDIRGLLRELLVRAGYEVALAEDGLAGLRSLYASPPSLVMLDVAMPSLDGWETLARIRDLTDVPVLMLTARASELDKVRGLRAGADDYVTKPFGRQELLARTAALLRRAVRTGEEVETYADSVLAIDVLRREVRVAGREVTLTPLEFRLLAELVRHPDVVLSHEQILDLVWGDSRAVSRDQVKLYVGYLRRKLGPEGSLIETVRGFGYRYRPRRPGRRAAGVRPG
jgi:DNA-binding response OmpR family regulator